MGNTPNKHINAIMETFITPEMKQENARKDPILGWLIEVFTNKDLNMALKQGRTEIDLVRLAVQSGTEIYGPEIKNIKIKTDTMQTAVTDLEIEQVRNTLKKNQ